VRFRELTTWDRYYIQARDQNNLVWSRVIEGVPKSVPNAPINVEVRVISGSCVEVFHPQLRLTLRKKSFHILLSNGIHFPILDQ